MTYLGLAVCLALIAFGSASAIASLVLAPLLRRFLARGGASCEALFALRFAPTVLAALFVGAFFVPAFLRHEPQRTTEAITPAMIALAAAAALVLAAGPLRGFLSILALRRLARNWESGAVEVDLPGAPARAMAVDVGFPLVAVVGTFRPRLYIARQVLERCAEDEVAAIMAHEAGHVRRRDNLTRLLLRSCPDLLAFGRLASRTERAWTAACDRAADDDATRGGGRLTLASALVKVARLARPLDPRIPAAAFCEGGDLAGRVRRLLDPETGAGGPPSRRRPLAGAAAAALALLLLPAVIEASVLRRLHELTEIVVRSLQ